MHWPMKVFITQVVYATGKKIIAFVLTMIYQWESSLGELGFGIFNSFSCDLW